MTDAHQGDTTRTSDANAVTAINILLEPDATMSERALADNARLLQAFPPGFALDERHSPHVTLLQRFVQTSDLDRIVAAASQVFAGLDVRSIRMEANGYYYIPSGEIGLAGITTKPNAVMREIQQQLVEAIMPYSVPTGLSDAFVTTTIDPVIDPMLIEYVATFVPSSIGERFNPQVTIGIAARDYLDQMLAEPFVPFRFAPANAAVYQLGQFGTAARKLHRWT